MSITVAESVLLASMKAKMPAVLVGPPGVGKTSKIAELTNRLGYKLITLIGSQLDPTDIVGLPKAELMGETESGEQIFGTVNLSPWWQVEILRNKKIVLFLDEMSNTSAATRASMLTMLQSREFPNGTKMPAETIVVGAMNPAEEAADGYDLDYPTTNRINFIVWSPSVSEWETGMLNAWGKKVSATEMNWREKIVGFIRDNPGELQRLPSEISTPEAFGVNPNNASEMEVFRYAWPSRRSWDNLARVLAHAKDTVVQDTLAQGIVGYSAALKFRDWLSKNNSFSPREVLQNPSIVNWRELPHSEANFIIRALLDGISDYKVSVAVIRVFNEIAKQGAQGVAAGYIRELSSKATDKKFGEENVKINRNRIIKLSQNFSNVAKRM